MRGRPRTFDRDQVLEQALSIFWERGYGATAIGDLTECMGIGRQSLYDTFGDKHALFLEALSRYCDRRLEEAKQMLSAETPPLDNLREFFAMWKQEALDGTCGCMIVNSSAELGDIDDSAARIMERMMGRLEDQFCDLLERAKDAGDLTSCAKPRQLARVIISASHGLAARSRLGLDATEIDDVLGTLLIMLAGRS